MGIRGHSGFVQVTGHRGAGGDAGPVAPPAGVGGAQGTNGTQHLDLLVAQDLGIEMGGRLHGDQRQQLEEMALHHVAQRTGALVIAGAVADTAGLGHGDLHLIDMIAVPQGLDQGIGETEHQEILHCLLAQVVIDPVDALLCKMPVQAGIQAQGAGEVLAEGLFDHDAVATGRGGQSGGAETLHHGGEIGWRHRQVEHPVGAVATRGRTDVLAQPVVVGTVMEIAAEVIEAVGEAREHTRVRTAFEIAVQHFGEPGAPLCITPVAPRERDQAQVRLQLSCRIQTVERGQQLAAGEIAGGPEDHEVAGGRCGHRVNRACPRDGRRNRGASVPAADGKSHRHPDWRSVPPAPGR